MQTGRFETGRFEAVLVSAVTPVYNEERYLAAFLDSILAQTYGRLEVILADDGSGDGTVALAESYRERMEQRGIRFVILRGGHRNASHALRAGLALVTGEYLIWPDADDVLEKDSVRARVAFLDQHPDVQCVRSLAYYFNPETGERAAADEKRGDLKQERLFWDVLESRTFVCCGCYMLRSEAFFAIYPGGKIPVSFVGQNFQMLLPFLYRHACPTIGRELYGVAVRASRKRAGNGRRNHMRLFERKEECCGCGACEAVCAARAIVMRQDEEGFFYPQADETRCTGCGACLRVCPLKREKREEKKAPARGYYGARTLQEDVRERSSSGGVFSVLADWVLEREGAASPGIWEKYVRFLGRRYGGKIRDFEFRDKRGKDNGHTVSWKNGNTQRAYSLYADPYCRLYFQDLILRPSCYECPFCRPERESDFTIGDFWGLERIRPDLDDGMGNSLVIVHSERAERIWREAARRCLSFECRLEDLLQPRLAAPTPRPAARERFMKWYRLLPFWILLKKYGG